MNYEEAIQYLIRRKNRSFSTPSKGRGAPGYIAHERRWTGITEEIVEFALETDTKFWQFNMTYKGIPLVISAGDLSFMDSEEVEGTLMFHIKSSNCEFKEYMKFHPEYRYDLIKTKFLGDSDFAYGEKYDGVVDNIKWEDMIKTGTMERPIDKNRIIE